GPIYILATSVCFVISEELTRHFSLSVVFYNYRQTYNKWNSSQEPSDFRLRLNINWNKDIIMKFDISVSCVCISVMALFCATAYGGCNRLRKSTLKDEWLQRKNKSKCQPVKLPVPLTLEGFTRLSPSVMFVNHCDENFDCSHVHNMKCLPWESRNITVKASGYDKKSRSTKCVSVVIQEHLSCECGCPGTTMCNEEKQVFNDTFCRCDCKKELADNCHLLRMMNPSSGIMFHDDICECKCPEEKTCGTGQVFSRDSCECMPMVWSNTII
ncbi:unnamed protein product, partial [Meganyctiphanes norvegica]